MNSSGWGTRHRRLILGVGVGIIASWYGILLASYALVPALTKLIRARSAEVLRAEFATEVRFQTLDVTFFPLVHIVAHGVVIGPSACPLIQAATADAYSGILPWHVRRVVLEGLSVRIPTTAGPPVPAAKPAATVQIDEIDSEHAQVAIVPCAGDRTPLLLELSQLRVRNFDGIHDAEFSASVVSSQPRGDIQASGRLGPWNAQDPSHTSVQGTYRIAQADLATLPGMRGILSGEGRFQGVFERIEIAGNADVPQFGVSLSGHPEPLHASFQATVDASDGSGSIQNLNGALGNSSFAGKGLAIHVQDDRLRDIAIDASVSNGRMEDFLPLVVQSRTSPMSGALRLQANLEIPPGDRNMVDRISLTGDFSATDARFSSLDLRERLRSVSRKAEGHPDDKTAGSSMSSMQGHFQMNGGAVEFSNLSFELEGASALLNGSYQLASQKLDLHGQVWIAAKVSQTTTGVKAFFLKAVDPFFRSKRGGSLVPVKITGTRSDPEFGLNVAK